uniref:Uncharacterized protein n=1 Tax=Alexandrium catenella TaxID=2925 RepID=A0A7S1RL53_ALECA
MAQGHAAEPQVQSYSPFLACRSGCAFWAFALCGTDLCFTLAQPPRHVPQSVLLITEAIHISLMLPCCIMLMQKGELVLQPVEQHVGALQRVLRRFLWFLAWPRLSWALCLYVALLAWSRAQDKYLLGGAWCEWLVSFWKSFAFCTGSICLAELLVGIYHCLAQACRRLAGSAKAAKGD